MARNQAFTIRPSPPGAIHYAMIGYGDAQPADVARFFLHRGADQDEGQILRARPHIQAPGELAPTRHRFVVPFSAVGDDGSYGDGLNGVRSGVAALPSFTVWRLAACRGHPLHRRFSTTTAGTDGLPRLVAG